MISRGRIMLMSNTDRAWEQLGRNDPYFAVIVHEKYHRGRLNENSLREFFESGQAHIDFVIRTIRTHLNPHFQPTKALDFGCGVGRLIVPLALICDFVVGVDVSESMLQEARKNCDERGISNVEFIKVDDLLSDISDTFNFINSFIVFQHIPCKRGELLLRRLIYLLEEDGVGVLHFTYFRKETKMRKLVSYACKSFPFVHNLRNLIMGRGLSYPLIQMNHYNLNNLFLILQETGCHSSYVRFTNHSGHYGVLLFFQKKHLDSAC
jgi:SAM-dependent methyltransferase